MTLTPSLLTMVMLTAMWCASSHAQTSAPPRTWLQLSGMSATWQMQTRTDLLPLPASTAPSIQVENTLGAPRHGNIIGLSFGRLIGERWRVEVEHTRSRRHGQVILGADLDVGGVVFLGGTALRSDIGLTTLGVNGGVALIKDERAELGLILGGMWIRTSLHSDGFTSGGNGAPGAVQPYRSHGGGSTPLPLVGVYGHLGWGPDWRLQGRAEFGLASLRHSRLSLAAQWHPNRHLGLGLGYRYIKTDVDVTYSFIGTTHLQLNYQAHGPLLTLDLAF